MGVSAVEDCTVSEIQNYEKKNASGLTRKFFQQAMLR